MLSLYLMKDRYLIFDFDSTFVQIEALDELAQIALEKAENKEETVREIKKITQLGMDGKLSFQESLSRRLALFTISDEHIKKVTELLLDRISTSFLRNKEFFKKNSERIYIISGGFKEYITPVVTLFDIAFDHILANEFIFNETKNVVGYDKNNFLSMANGKVLQVEALKLNGEVVVIGDGFTDYQIKAQGKASTFIAFTENVFREVVVKNADFVVSSVDELISKLEVIPTPV